MADVATGVAATGMKVSKILIDVVAPIGALMAGFGIGDLGVHFVLKQLTDMLLPEAFLKNSLVDVLKVVTAGIYFALSFLVLRIGGWVGRVLAGLLAGIGARVVVDAISGTPLWRLKPKGA